MNDTFETVHTMDDYYDGPRSGIAAFEGRPHYYRSIYLDSSEWNPDEDRFELSPVSADVLAAACEADAIFNRWDRMRKSTPGFTYTDEEFGALPEERVRFQELQQFLEVGYAAAAKSCRILVHGEFRTSDSSPRRLQVRWRFAKVSPK